MIEPRKESVEPGEWLVARTLFKVRKGKILVQLINLGTTPIALSNHATLSDLYAVPHHCISEAQPGVEATCALLQLAMASLDKSQYKLLLEQLDIPFQDYPQRLLHQLLEKHVLVFATSPEDYGYTKAIDHPKHTREQSRSSTTTFP